MGSGTARFVLSSLMAGFLFAGSLTYGLLWGVPQWNQAFHGTLAPAISAYGGWPMSIGIVTVGLLMTGIFAGLSWKHATVDYLIPALGVVSVLAFVVLGLPAPIIAQIRNALSLVVVALCGLMVAGILFLAFRDRLSRNRRGVPPG
jgi:hypothetical protein